MKIKPTSAKKCPLSTKEHARLEVATSLNKSSERTKSSAKTPHGRKTARLGVIEEVAKPSKNEASSSVPRSMSRGRRPTTIPKEPYFHTIHVPKSCTKKVVA